jgi:hypothetical protein
LTPSSPPGKLMQRISLRFNFIISSSNQGIG